MLGPWTVQNMPCKASTRSPESLKTAQRDIPREMDTATLKQFLLVSFVAATLLGIFCASGSPSHRCPGLPIQLRLYKLQADAGKELRNRYEHLCKKEQPWQNCSAKHLQPSWHLNDLTQGWDKLEAMESTVSLSLRVLQNRSEEVADKIIVKVLDVLGQLERHLQACISKKPAGCNESEHLQKFKEKFQKFKTSNLEQSPKCLEAAVGLDIHRLLKKDIHDLLKAVVSHIHG